MFQIEPVRRALVGAKLDGWLFYDFRGLDPIARRVLGLDRSRTGTRRWFYFIPAAGEPRKLVHAIEPGMLDALPGARTVYLSWQSLREGLAGMLAGSKTVAMQYSPRNDVPYVSRVDAGTVELVRSLGVEVASSADLVQAFDATLTEEQLASHRRAAKFLRGLMDEAFSLVTSSARAGRGITEKDVGSFMIDRLAKAGFTHDHLPIVAVNDHAANPHFEIPQEGSSPVKKGDLLLIDVWAKETAAGSIYADITWTAFVGEKVPEEIAAVFRVVREARDAAVARAQKAFRSGEPLRGCDLDRVAREVIERAGHGERFIHRTGHSIHEDGHGNGANIDDLETHDTRLLLPRTLFSIEPGIYLPGHFGIRSEVDVYHTGSDAEVTGPPHQEEVIPLLR